MTEGRAPAGPRLAIVADDLTGAVDSSGYFALKGFSVAVALDLDATLNEDVVVVTTDSRAEAPSLARERVDRAARRLRGRIVYKKVDSTLRGNIGVEIAAAMDALGCRKAVVAPAFPAVGRTTVGGHLLVNGVKVSETQFANDPVSPVRESHIATLLAQTVGRAVGCLGLDAVESGPEALYRAVAALPQPVVVCDVKEQAHLDVIALASGLAGQRWLLVGSGGLARSLGLLLGTPRGRRRRGDVLVSGPALVVIGTLNKVAGAQLLKARETTGLLVVDLAVERLGHPSAMAMEVERVAAEAGRSLEGGKSVAVTTAFSALQPSLKEEIPPALAGVVMKVMETQKPSGLFLSGGDIASGVCHSLGAAAIRVYGEVETGVPAGEIAGGRAGGMRVVTKAGGFGTNTALVKALAYLEKGCLS